jgi:pimeloyl-ACP methyl ester carboxylesterase
MMINFDRRGSGSPLVLLHGIGHRWQAWRPVLDRLAERHDVVAVDLPGFGLSPPVPDGISHDLGGSMEILDMIFQELGVQRPHVAGNSLGGLISVEAASRGMVASATALSPAGFWTNRDKTRALAMLRVIRAGALAPTPTHALLLGNARLRAATLSTLYAHPERIDQISAAGDMAALRGSTSFNPTMRAGREFSGWQGSAPTVPVTIAWGEKDRILPPRQAQRAARLLPAAHHVTLPHCGHVPMSDDPDLVAKVILDTCDRAERESSARAEQQTRAAAEQREQRQAS